MSSKPGSPSLSPEHQRLAEHSSEMVAPWRKWGPYVCERSWGSVREDYSRGWVRLGIPDARQARSKAYRWGEDGIAGICDRYQLLVFALALWNGRDPILKERMFGLTGNEGNHGEDVKEYWFYLDNTPTHSYMRMLYKYPQRRVSVHAVDRRKPPPVGASGSAGVRTAGYRHFRRRPILRHLHRVREGGPRRYLHSHRSRSTVVRTLPSCTCCRISGSATPGLGLIRRSREPSD